MDAIDKWLESKKDSKSKRWDDVIRIKEHLTEAMEKKYNAELNNNPDNEYDDDHGSQMTAQF